MVSLTELATVRPLQDASFTKNDPPRTQAGWPTAETNARSVCAEASQAVFVEDTGVCALHMILCVLRSLPSV
jgi:hypothetical protein